MTQKDKQFFLPYPIEDKATRISMQEKGIEVSYYSFGNKKCLVAWVPNYDEKVYHDFMRVTWSDLKSKENETRCLIQAANGKGLKVCHNSCKDCPHLRCGLIASLDEEQEQTGFDVEDSSVAIFEIATLRMVLGDLFVKLRKQNPILADILEDMYQGLSQKQIARKRNKSTGTIGEQAKAACALARKILGEE